MNTTKTRNITRLLFVAATAGSIVLGAASSVSASTEPPTDASAAPDVPPPTAGEPASPEAAAFCEASVGVEAAANSEDPAAIEPAIAAAREAAPADAAPLYEAVITAFEATGGEGPEFAAAYDELIAWMEDNCGYVTLNLTASEYAFGGMPTELPAGGTIINLANIGEEVHEVLVLRINDDVTLTVDELIGLPEEEGQSMTTFVGIGFAFPETVGHALVNLDPGRYIVACFVPEGLTPDVASQMGGPESSTPPGVVLGPPHALHGMVQEFTVS